MFHPSGKSLTYFCNAVFTLGGWNGLLERYGLDQPGKPLYAPFDSWQNLKNHVDDASLEQPERLRALCSDLLRRRDTFADDSEDKDAFLDNLAHFEVQIQEEGYLFDGFQIRGKKAAPSVSQLADKALEEFLTSPYKIPLGHEVGKHLSLAVEFLSDGNYIDSLTNLRLALKFALEGIARAVAENRGEELPSDKESDVRNYLKNVGFLTEEEWRGFWGIYGLLSTGPHGRPSRNAAFLGFVACVAACNYAIEKFRSIGCV